MIDTQNNHIVIECDACGGVFDSAAEGCGSLEWEVVWPAAKREGWKARRIGGEWLQLCARCKP
jgi:hypothetical protein